MLVETIDFCVDFDKFVVLCFRCAPAVECFVVLFSVGGMEDRIDATIRDLKALDPRIVVPGHCTGWKAKAKLAEVFPTNMQPCVVGATYKFSSSEKEH